MKQNWVQESILSFELDGDRTHDLPILSRVKGAHYLIASIWELFAHLLRFNFSDFSTFKTLMMYVPSHPSCWTPYTHKGSLKQELLNVLLKYILARLNGKMMIGEN